MFYMNLEMKCTLNMMERDVQTLKFKQSNHRFSFMFAFIYCLVFKFMLMCFAVYGAFLIHQFNLKKG